MATNEHLLLKHKLGKASSAHLTLPNDEYLYNEKRREHERSRLPIGPQLSCLPDLSIPILAIAAPASLGLAVLMFFSRARPSSLGAMGEGNW